MDTLKTLCIRLNLKAHESILSGALGRIFWAKSRETHLIAPANGSGIWSKLVVDVFWICCHCVEIARTYIVKTLPIEVMCWADTQVKPMLKITPSLSEI